MKSYSIRTANTSSNGWGLQEEVSHTLDRTAGPAVGITIHGTDKTVRVASFTDTAGALRARTPGGQENSSTTAVLTPAIGWCGDATPKASIELSPSLRREQGGEGVGVGVGMAVRRLTPRECERLQGFPDDYTLVPHKGKMTADGVRYKALGNSMAVPCMRWIGERIQMVEDALKEIEESRPENGQRV